MITFNRYKKIKLCYYPRRELKVGIHFVYQPGDFVPGVGVVDTNHCGLPCPCI